MLKRIRRSSALILVVCFALPACSMLTKSGRQQLAYQRYVRKCSHRRDRQRAKMKTPRIPTFAPSENKINTEVGGSPESVTSGQSQGEQASPQEKESAPSQ
jgi:hypothetical protein